LLKYLPRAERPDLEHHKTQSKKEKYFLILLLIKKSYYEKFKVFNESISIALVICSYSSIVGNLSF